MRYFRGQIFFWYVFRKERRPREHCCDRHSMRANLGASLPNKWHLFVSRRSLHKCHPGQPVRPDSRVSPTAWVEVTCRRHALNASCQGEARGVDRLNESPSLARPLLPLCSSLRSNLRMRTTNPFAREEHATRLQTLSVV